MAFAIVQHNAFNGGVSTSPTLCVYGLSVTAGNLLLCAYNIGNGGAVTGLTDGPGNTWTRIDSEFNEASNGQKYGWFYAANSKAGATTITVGFTGSLAAQTYVICEVSGVATTTPLRQSNRPAAAGTTSATANAEKGTSLTTSAGDFLAAMLDISNAPPTNTAGTGFTLIDTAVGNSGLSGSTAMEWATATGSDQAQFTTTDVGNPYMVNTALFIPAAAGGNVLRSSVPFMSPGRI